jgi:hypothetical protein
MSHANLFPFFLTRINIYVVLESRTLHYVRMISQLQTCSQIPAERNYVLNDGNEKTIGRRGSKRKVEDHSIPAEDKLLTCVSGKGRIFIEDQRDMKCSFCGRKICQG